MRLVWCVAGVSIIVLSMATQAMASVVTPAPEIDGGSIAGGLSLLAGGVLLARARWRSK